MAASDGDLRWLVVMRTCDLREQLGQLCQTVRGNTHFLAAPSEPLAWTMVSTLWTKSPALARACVSAGRELPPTSRLTGLRALAGRAPACGWIDL
jgi:hypothetical protein